MYRLPKGWDPLGRLMSHMCNAIVPLPPKGTTKGLGDIVPLQPHVPPPGRTMTVDAPQCLRQVKETQGERVQTYTKFEAAFAQFLRSGDFPPYQMACTECTLTFQKCSQDVMAIERTFRSSPPPPSSGRVSPRSIVAAGIPRVRPAVVGIPLA